MKVWKKLTALALCAACVCALICVPPAKAAAAVSTFPDITDAQVGRAVEALRTMGVIDGSGGLYLPGDSLTRAQFCKMALLVMGKGSEADAQASRTIFSDVPGSHWARGYVNLAATTTVGGEADKGGSRLMMGLGNGTFAPDRPITYGEAVTAILRILEYVKEASANWPYGAVSTASALGLDSGFTPPAAGDPIDRAQAALLFCNMLTTPMEGDKGIFASSLGTVQENWLLVSLDAKTASGREGAVQFVDKTGKKEPVLPAVHAPSAFFLGTQGTAVMKDGQLLTFIPHMNADSRTLTVADATSGSTCTITGSDGSKLSFTRSTVVLNGATLTDYGAIYSELHSGASVVACFDTSGAVDYLYIESFNPVDSLKGGVMVARDKVSGNPFAQLTAGTTDYKIVKNGAEVTTSALKQYDVAAFDPTGKILYVTDFRLTGVYESATPNTTLPTKIKVLGKELDVLDSALDDLKDLKLNSTITLLLSPNGKVAGAVSSSTLRSNTVGWISKVTPGDENSDGSITVSLLNAPNDSLSTITGKYSGSLSTYADTLVTVSGSTNSRLSLSRFNGRSTKDTLDVEKRILGSTPLAENVAVFDRIQGSAFGKVSLAAIGLSNVPASKIVGQRTNAAGQVDILVLDNVTGDLYTYGMVTNSVKEDTISHSTTLIIDGKPVPEYERGEGEITPGENPDSFQDEQGRPTDSHGYLLVNGKRVPAYVKGIEPIKDGKDAEGNVVDKDGYVLKDGQKIPLYQTTTTSEKIYNNTTTIENGSTSVKVIGGNTYAERTFAGLAASQVNELYGLPRSAGSVALKSVTKVTPANFNMSTGIFFSGSIELPIWDEVQCYNARTKIWIDVSEKDKPASPMDNLNACLAYSNDLTVYYDRDPAQGGKVRIVVAN